MYDPTIHPKTLTRHFKAQDFTADPQLFHAIYKQGYTCPSGRLRFTRLSTRDPSTKHSAREVYLRLYRSRRSLGASPHHKQYPESNLG